MFIISSNTSRFRSQSRSNLAYQSVNGALNGELQCSPIQKSAAAWVTRVAGRLTARPRATDALARPAMTYTLPRAYPTSSQAQFSFPSPPPQAATELSARHCCRASFTVAELVNHRKNANSVFTIAPSCPPLPSPPPSCAIRALVRSL